MAKHQEKIIDKLRLSDERTIGSHHGVWRLLLPKICFEKYCLTFDTFPTQMEDTRFLQIIIKEIGFNINMLGIVKYIYLVPSKTYDNVRPNWMVHHMNISSSRINFTTKSLKDGTINDPDLYSRFNTKEIKEYKYGSNTMKTNLGRFSEPGEFIHSFAFDRDGKRKIMYTQDDKLIITYSDKVRGVDDSMVIPKNEICQDLLVRYYVDKIPITQFSMMIIRKGKLQPNSNVHREGIIYTFDSWNAMVTNSSLNTLQGGFR